MAAVSLSPALLHRTGMLSNRRVPLADNPNATNSPYRAVAAAAQKRSRYQSDTKEDVSYDQQPPAKRQAVELERSSLRTPPRKQGLQNSEGRIFNKRPTSSQPTAFERKLLAAKTKQVDQKVEKHEKGASESLEEIRQWQRHYRRVFPHFVFYFESVPDEVRVKYSKHVRTLGAREEKFFSKDVTHIVTTRVVPSEADLKSPTDSIYAPALNPAGSQTGDRSRTINPSVLDRTNDTLSQGQLRNKFTFEASVGRRPISNNSRDVEQKKPAGVNANILSRAREMGMKIWQLEKLQRVTNTMFETPADSQSQHGHNTRSNMPVAGAPVKHGRGADLSRMLRNERLNGPSDLDPTVATNELVTFKGPYIYIRDMDEKTKPVLVREYAKKSNHEQGDWPQFRSASHGKCPFVEESRQDAERARAREQEMLARAQAEKQKVPRTRSATRSAVAAQTYKLDPTQDSMQRQPLLEAKNGMNPALPAQAALPEKGFCPPPPTNSTNSKGSRTEMGSMPAPGPRLFGGEPAASGLQASNITSAIRSQMISSTAAAPGAKTGISREIHGLKRKVLEKNSGPALSNMQTSQRTAAPIGVTRANRSIAPPRQTRKKPQETLVHIDEESTQSEEEEDVWRTEEVRRTHIAPGRKIVEKDSKPGYCENCREKYDDFDDHIIGRKHRKFAVTAENWKDLDKLLEHLGRQLKEENYAEL